MYTNKMIMDRRKKERKNEKIVDLDDHVNKATAQYSIFIRIEIQRK
jgi:hypothetical protein